ncbi:hypothetical protein K458DRAFT_405611 [Lentithecium fluviatile CBS 122367]|uniref:Uncharacterized protein n=1 Tax=Lentithecium fluviatile CBS 122367 TaxID=1168545 RepID=A0A6G1IWH2_9PLEO|nr:hypothetical protein K458DRAFT_405611 [Lentithecium fluviatile CBS 122367]
MRSCSDASNSSIIQHLTKINDESKSRRKTKSYILGKARVLGYEDIEAARAKRAEQEASKEAKGKRKPGRPKRMTLEADAATMETKNRKRHKCTNVTQEAEEVIVQTSKAHIAEESAPPRYRAPVARMY